MAHNQRAGTYRGLRRCLARRHAGASEGSTAPRQQGSHRSGIISSRKEGEVDARLPRYLRMPRGDQLRSSPTCRRCEVIVSLSALCGEMIVPCGGNATNALGLTKQIPVKSVYLTSGPNRRLTLGELTVTLRHASRWQLAAPHRPARAVVRALSWLVPDEVEVSLGVIRRKLSSEDLQELAGLRAILPT